MSESNGNRVTSIPKFAFPNPSSGVSNQMGSTATRVRTEIETQTETNRAPLASNHPRSKLGIFGAGGHAKVVADIARAGDEYEVVAFFDDDEARHGEYFYGAKILGGQELVFGALGSGEIDAIIVAVGHNEFRRTLGDSLRERGYTVATLIHPSAVLAPTVRVSSGTVVMAGAVINADSCIKEDVIINTRCSIDHDCVIGAGTHIAPGVTLCGGVSIGSSTLVGVGSCARPNVHVGERVTIGAGSVIVADIEDDTVAFGVPAKRIESSSTT